MKQQKDTAWEFEPRALLLFLLNGPLALFGGGVGQIVMQGGYAGDEGVTLQASKPFIDPLDEEARNSGLITQGEKSA